MDRGGGCVEFGIRTANGLYFSGRFGIVGANKEDCFV
jgi:hypothetical protein